MVVNLNFFVIFSILCMKDSLYLVSLYLVNILILIVFKKKLFIMLFK